MDCINVSGDLTPSVVAKFIDLFQENKYSTMFTFDKGKTIKQIMIMFLGLNLSSALNFLFLGSFSGSYISFLQY